jgi:DNA-binding transcriptional LysR family regulator
MSQSKSSSRTITKSPRINPVSVAHALVVAEHLSFRGAARALGMRQSSLSRRVRGLEDKLGVSIFERHRRGVTVTNAGARFLQQARDALVHLDEATKIAGAAGQGATGQLSIGIRSSIAGGFLRELLEMYSAKHPDVAMQFVEGASTEQISLIRKRHLDVAFVADTGEAADCDVAPLWSERLFVALPDNHPLGDLKTVEWKALRKEHFIFRQSKWGAALCERVIKHLSDRGHTPRVEKVDVGRETVMHLVAMGRGVSLTSEATIVTSFPGVAFRPISGGDATLQFSAVWWPGNDNPALRRLLSLARVLAREKRKHQHGTTPRHRPGSISSTGNQLVVRLSRRARKKARSVDMNRASIGATSLAGSTAWPVSPPSTSA